MQMRIDLVLLLSVWCAGCASSFEKPVAQAPAPQPAAVAASPAPVADAASPKFECSDGTISFSQTGCLVNMARERLPPSQRTDPASTGSVTTGPLPAPPAR
jgi:hypothetical protein